VPIQSLLREAPEQLPEITFRMNREQFTVIIGDETLAIVRDAISSELSEEDELPEDVDEHLPSP